MSTKKDRALLDARMKKYEESGVAQLDDAYEKVYLNHDFTARPKKSLLKLGKNPDYVERMAVCEKFRRWWLIKEFVLERVRSGRLKRIFKKHVQFPLYRKRSFVEA